ncbi:MAG: GTPase ObgE [Chloroflexaceae bacterium]|nr:GTPase ObgE [Chloroflexaceae bacterium]
MSGEMVDQATIVVRSGTGGNGSATFRREKYIPHGGPDGGDGGRGGHVYLVADAEVNTLLPLRYETRFAAEDGGHGSKNRKHGRNGSDLNIAVPPGTIVRAEIHGETYTMDLECPGQRLLVVRGGRGGLGNVHFTTPSRQAPRIAELGEPGEELTLELELKLIADVGLVGFPNAGKSTLLSVISAARPKIASYPFTTLQPNLGVVDVGFERFVVADIPGLIENAHQGVGLGFDFLRHIERTRLLLHVIDAAGVDGRDPVQDFHQINHELRSYHPELAERPQIVVLNKLDLPLAQENLDRLMRDLPLPRSDIFPVAAATHQGIAPLLTRVAQRLRDLPVAFRDPVSPDTPPLTWPVPEVDPNLFAIEREGDGWRVRGIKIERLIRMTNFDQPESLDRVQRVLAASGISQALVDAGVQEGDAVSIAQSSLVWSDTSTYG